jgi:hypothetical protein
VGTIETAEALCRDAERSLTEMLTAGRSWYPIALVSTWDHFTTALINGVVGGLD